MTTNKGKQNMKTITTIGFLTAIALISSACAMVPLCGDGQVACGDSCAPSGASCCDANSGSYCQAGYVCAPGNLCVGSGVVTSNPVSSCLSMGEQTCTNTDGIDDCSPIGSSCCHDHRYCPEGFVCGGGCGSECCP